MTPPHTARRVQPVQIDQFLIGSHRNFVYLVTSGGQSVVIDPQSDLNPWQMRMKELGSSLVGVALTHSHWDHVAGVPAIVEQAGARPLPIYVHELDARRLADKPARVRECFDFVAEGDEITVGSHALQVLHTPGHSAGECCYLLRVPGSPDVLFTGDTVFVGDVGRCDLESGSVSEMFQTLARLKRLAPETVIYPGHDYGRTPTTTVGRESASSAAWLCKTEKELDALP